MQAGYRKGFADAQAAHIVEEVDTAAAAVGAELYEAMHNFPPMASQHEGYAVILEELDELWEEIKKRPSQRSLLRMRVEAKQVAAMAIRFMVDITPTSALTEAEE